MFFKNRQSSEQRRARRPIARDGSSSSPVFSYHARSARTNNDSGRRKPASVWQNTDDTAVSAQRLASKKWVKRLSTGGIGIAIVLVVVGNLTLSREPHIIPLTGAQDRQAFLHSQDTYQQTAQTILASSWANTNKLTVDTQRIARAMQKQFPELETVTVTMPIFGRQPQIYIQPARPALLLKTADGGTFVLDTAGRALMNASQLPKVEKMGLALVDDQSGLAVTLGRTALPRANVAFITEVVGQLRAKKVDIVSLALPKSTNELDVKVGGVPYIVKFNLRGDARAEAGAYLAVKQHLEREKKTPGTYIDVRVDNKAYYR